MPVINRLSDFHNEMTTWRRELHQNPQTAYTETYAARFVAERLRAWGVEVHEGIATTGIVGVLKGKKPGQRTIGLRADMDALDIAEKNDFAYCSKTPGKMHACGHDGHTTTLLGAARYLAETRNFAGTVNFIFQPAEEGQGGAQKMIDEGLFKKFPCDAVFGFHNWPDMPVGKIALRTGPLLAAADKFSLTIAGKGGHAAAPHHTIDPVVIGCHIVTAWQSLISRGTDPLDSAVISVTQFTGGMAFNVIPDQVELAGTVRTFLPKTRDHLQSGMQKMAMGIAEGFGASVTFNYQRNTDPTINWPKEAEFAANIARDIVGKENVDDAVAPTMGAEDFGAMLANRPGCYIFIGSQDETHKAKLHNPHYDFNDEIMPIGASYFARLVEQYLTA